MPAKRNADAKSSSSVTPPKPKRSRIPLPSESDEDESPNSTAPSEALKSEPMHKKLKVEDSVAIEDDVVDLREMASDSATTGSATVLEPHAGGFVVDPLKPPAVAASVGRGDGANRPLFTGEGVGVGKTSAAKPEAHVAMVPDSGAGLFPASPPSAPQHKPSAVEAMVSAAVKATATPPSSPTKAQRTNKPAAAGEQDIKGMEYKPSTIRAKNEPGDETLGTRQSLRTGAAPVSVAATLSSPSKSTSLLDRDEEMLDEDGNIKSMTATVAAQLSILACNREGIVKMLKGIKREMVVRLICILQEALQTHRYPTSIERLLSHVRANDLHLQLAEKMKADGASEQDILVHLKSRRRPLTRAQFLERGGKETPDLNELQYFSFGSIKYKGDLDITPFSVAPSATPTPLTAAAGTGAAKGTSAAAPSGATTSTATEVRMVAGPTGGGGSVRPTMTSPLKKRSNQPMSAVRRAYFEKQRPFFHDEDRKDPSDRACFGGCSDQIPPTHWANDFCVDAEGYATWKCSKMAEAMRRRGPTREAWMAAGYNFTESDAVKEHPLMTASA